MMMMIIITIIIIIIKFHTKMKINATNIVVIYVANK
jgi:hypothetical protein